jgi:hypothetical protein
MASDVLDDLKMFYLDFMRLFEKFIEFSALPKLVTCAAASVSLLLLFCSVCCVLELN